MTHFVTPDHDAIHSTHGGEGGGGGGGEGGGDSAHGKVSLPWKICAILWVTKIASISLSLSVKHRTTRNSSLERHNQLGEGGASCQLDGLY